MQLTEIPVGGLHAEQLAFFQREGYLIVRNLFTPAEVDELRGRYDRLVDGTEPAPPGKWPNDPQAADPLQRCPRVMMPHRWDALAKRWLLDPRLRVILRELLGDERIATQSMYYFKC